MSPPQHHRRRTKTSNSITSTNHLTRTLFHRPPSYRVLRSTIHNRRRSLRLNILRSHRIPRTACHHWIILLGRMSSTPNPIPLHIRTSLWLRSRCLILTFRRRSMTIPLRIHLLMRLINLSSIKISISDFQSHGLG